MASTLASAVDLNADVGEGMTADAHLMAIITSANVACAAHAGDPDSIRNAFLLAKKHRVAVGAHVGYFDVANFGRTERPVTAESIHSTFAACIYQIGALVAFAKHFRVKVKYVKPHGALYNQACRDVKLGEAVVAACHRFKLPLMVLASSPLHKKYRGDIDMIAEGFADRAYQKDGTLVPRTEPHAILHDVDTIVAQVERLVTKQGVESICIHGDTPDAVKLASAVKGALIEKGLAIRAVVR